MTDCTCCGDCCQNISLASMSFDRAADYWTTCDPRTEEGWEQWRAKGWLDECRERTVENWVNVTFMAEHWYGVGRDAFSCDAFDPKTRLCMAHEERPPVCRGYPWYGRQPSFEKAEHLSKRCSFRADVLTGTLVSIGATR